MSRIAILEFGHLGDGILLLPLLSALSKSGRQDEILVVGADCLRDVLSLVAGNIRHHSFSHHFNARPGQSWLTSLQESGRLWGALRRFRPDVCIETKGHRSTASYALLAGKAHRVGPAGQGGSFFFHQTATQHSEPEALRKLRFADALGVQRPPRLYDLHLPEAGQLAAASFLKSTGVSGSFGVIHPLTPWRPRDWPLERYAELAGRLRSSHADHLVVVGSSPAPDVVAALSSSGAHVVDSGGALSIPELAGLLSSASVYIGSDSGPAHLAAACRCPSVILLGPAEYPRFVPYNPEARIKILRHAVCPRQRENNCKQIFGSDTCSQGRNVCMEAITLDEVFAACEELLEGRAVAAERPHTL